eukprot:CAMPEP_0177651288 /NCGR_PEP_ID=MMETSP0447-20121125/12458_1 /TAXON_ID=0 /ORGANISM="Stygamoeba regulata, Strain BSH-02190019" /LENGTH=147 /DNA_ID=CAMNT_0019154339 /DNA_START=30 /DNA_END=473 /DNA_ORIENTATION=-
MKSLLAVLCLCLFVSFVSAEETKREDLSKVLLRDLHIEDAVVGSQIVLKEEEGEGHLAKRIKPDNSKCNQCPSGTKQCLLCPGGSPLQVGCFADYKVKTCCGCSGSSCTACRKNLDCIGGGKCGIASAGTVVPSIFALVCALALALF